MGNVPFDLQVRDYTRINVIGKIGDEDDRIHYAKVELDDVLSYDEKPGKYIIILKKIKFVK